MTRREKLQENFEEALFALLMDEAAEQEGRRLLEENERLKQDPGSAIPEEVNQRCLKTIQRAFAKERRRTAGRTAYRAFRQAAVVAVIGMLLFATAFAAFPEVRIKTLNLLIEVSDVATSLSLIDENDPSETGDHTAADTGITGEGTLRGYRLPAVPEGFVLEESKDSRISSWVQYRNEEGALIVFDISSAKGGTLKVDTEDAVVDSIKIHGYAGLLIQKDDHVDITWGDTDQVTFVSIYCNGISKEQALAFAEEMVYVGAP